MERPKNCDWHCFKMDRNLIDKMKLKNICRQCETLLDSVSRAGSNFSQGGELLAGSAAGNV